MFSLLTVGFEFRDVAYYSVIRVKPKNWGVDYEITVMNGTLEKLLYGNHVIKQQNDYLEVEAHEATEQAELKVAIAEALSKLLFIPLRKKTGNELALNTSDAVAAGRYEMREYNSCS